MSKMNLKLKKTTIVDLETLFIFQMEKLSNYQAAFTSKNPCDKTFYLTKWQKIIKDPSICMKTIYLMELKLGVL